jgi:ATPase subunit of ABC transporter with duplicated ATPase domains
VLETLTRAADEAREDEIKALLGRMMFPRSSFERKVGVLSGGEKARLALAKFMLTSGTLLVLDEPTNHLDIPSKEMLEKAIVAFEGAVVAVSHDRYFLRKIANRVILVEDEQLIDYAGDYDFYLEVWLPMLLVSLPVLGRLSCGTWLVHTRCLWVRVHCLGDRELLRGCLMLSE